IYSINPNTGLLQKIGSVPTGKHSTGITIDPTGKYAYSVNSSTIYNPPHESISMYQVDKNGLLTPIGSIFTGSNPLRMTIDKSGKFAYVSSLVVGNNQKPEIS